MSGSDIFDSIYRALLGFLAGLFLAYMTKLAGSAGWQIAVVTTVGMAAFFWFMDSMNRGSRNLIYKMTGGSGIKPARRPAEPVTRHWLVRFGWLIALGVGFVAGFVVPQEVVAWIL